MEQVWVKHSNGKFGFSVQKKIYQNLGGNSFCDYILSASEFILEIEAPVITIVEAKNESTNVGLGQCIAEMVAA
ncbi:GUN4 domain-containing protein [Dapis sp. BLCC M229]|uniref:GUN4 domain-containing protein n=1 Tax=Dapis sp. BLCC M229 TaxID=3400188 RepID=UPI003CF7C899